MFPFQVWKELMRFIDSISIVGEKKYIVIWIFQFFLRYHINIICNRVVRPPFIYHDI